MFFNAVVVCSETTCDSLALIGDFTTGAGGSHRAYELGSRRKSGKEAQLG